MKEYVKNMEKEVENMKDYEGICGKYEGIFQKYEEIRRNISLGLGKIPNSPPLYGPWDLEKFTWALGLGKMSSSASI